MNKYIFPVLMLLALATLGSCVGFSPYGHFYTATVSAGSVTPAPFDAKFKVGRACARSYLWLVAIGDSSVPAAAANGRVTQVRQISYSTNTIGPLGWPYHEHCTIVHGE